MQINVNNNVSYNVLITDHSVISNKVSYQNTSSYAVMNSIYTRSPATAGIANRPLLFLEHRIPMPELFTVRRFTRVLEAGKYGCPY